MLSILINQIISLFVFAVMYQSGYIMSYLCICTFIMTMSYITSLLMFLLNEPEKYVAIITNIKKMMDDLASVECDNNNSIQIQVSPCGNYYKYDDIYYDIAFPPFWTLTHMNGTGPNQCNSCKDDGCFRGVFIMYCVNCAKQYDNNDVGYGAISSGVELITGNVRKSAWYTYLKDRNLNYIGLPEEMNSEDFDKPGFIYKLVCKRDVNGNIIKLYPDFVSEEDDRVIDVNEHDNDDIDWYEYSDIDESDDDESDIDYDDDESIIYDDESVVDHDESVIDYDKSVVTEVL